MPPDGLASSIARAAAAPIRFDHFAGRRHRHVGHDLELLGPHEFCDLPLGEKARQFLNTKPRPLVQHHEACGPFAQHRVRHGGDGDLGHGRMRRDDAFHFRWIELHAAAIDNVLNAAAQADVSLAVHIRKIAGPEPSVGGEVFAVRRGIADIAEKYRAPPHLQLADLAGGNR